MVASICLARWSANFPTQSPVGMAVRFSSRYALDGSAYGPMPPTSLAREFSSKSIAQGSAPCGNRKTGQLSHAPAFLCHGAVVSGLRYPNRAGTPWTQGCEHHDGVHACAEPAGYRGEKSARLATEEDAERSTSSPRRASCAQCRMRITPGRRRGRRGAAGRRRERLLAWAVFLAPVSYWVARRCPAAD